MGNSIRCRNCKGCKCLRKKTDKLLSDAASIFANTGKDSTPGEIAEAYAKEKELLLEVKRLDPELGAILLPDGTIKPE